MAKLKARGRQELFRFLSVKRRGLITVMDDGTRLIRNVGTGWRVLSHKKADLSLEQWTQKKMDWYNNECPEWRKVRHLPSTETLCKWALGDDAETTLGDPCEPDLVDKENNRVSWLVALGWA